MEFLLQNSSDGTANMVTIRLATLDDAEVIRDIYATFIESSFATFDTVQPTTESFRAKLEKVQRFYPWYVAEIGEQVVGYAYANEHHERPAYRWSVTASVYISEDHQRQGLGRRFYERLLPTLKRQGFRMVHAGITMPNEGSVKLHEAMGFHRVAMFPKAGYKFDSWRDVGWWVLDLMEGNESAHPSEPIPFPALVDESN